MSLKKINWGQIDTVNKPSGSVINLGNLTASLNDGYFTNLFISGTSLSELINTDPSQLNAFTASYKGATEVTGSNLTVKGNLLVNSNLITNGYISGSSLRITGDTYLDGTTYISSLNSTSNASFNNDLTVSGSTYLGNGVDDVLIVSGNAYFETLHNNRIVVAGNNGQLIDFSGLTFNDTELNVGDGNFTVQKNNGNIFSRGDLIISGNLSIFGSASQITIESNTVNIGDNIIKLNAFAPFKRYTGIEVIDSGSSDMSSSFVWDSLNDYWLMMSSSGQTSKVIGTTAGTYGSENSISLNFIQKATGNNTIGDSLLNDNGTTLSYGTNKFITDISGNTTVAGNLILSFSGGTDNGSKISKILFKNTNNTVGYVSTAQTTEVLDGILGYSHSDGTLIFSTIIDGGVF
jgi:hypothetical protein